MAEGAADQEVVQRLLAIVRDADDQPGSRLPQRAQQLNQAAVLQYQAGRPGVAAQLLEASLQADRQSSRTWLLLAQVQLGMGRLEEAERSCREALALFPGWAEGRQVLERVQTAKRR